MSPLLSSSPLARRLTIAAGAALAAATFTAPADAAFTTGKCLGDAVTGRGASFANNAHNQAFRPNFTTFCGDVGAAPAITYSGDGSGAGRRNFGERTGDNVDGSKSRTYDARFAGTDEPVTAASQANMNKGSDAVGDEGLVHTLPIAVGSVAIVVNVPNGCTIATKADGAALTAADTQLSDPTNADTRRIQLTRTQAEQIFNGGSEIDTWGELVSWINDGNGTPGEAGDTRCTSFPLVKIRRLDDSGTTFALKDYLSRINPGRGWTTTYNTPDTRTWPNATRTVAFDYNNDGDFTDAVPNCAAQYAPFNSVTCDESAVPLLQTSILPAGTGGGALMNKVDDFDGSIGYADLSTARLARSRAYERQTGADDRYWVKVQTKNTTGYADPQLNATGFQASGTTGSACSTAVVSGLPTGTDPTLGNFSQTTAADSTAAGYGLCSLTYALAWDDYAKPYALQPTFSASTEERKARTVKDYLESALTSGQSFLVSYDYAPLPESLRLSTLAGVQKIGFNKAGDVPAPEPKPEDKPAPPVVETPKANTPAPPNTPAPVAPSNAFTVGTPKNNKGTATLTVQVPGAGNVSIVAKATIGKKKNGQIASASSSAKASGPVAFTIKPSSAAAKELKKKKKLKVTLEITFTPTGGAAKTTTVTVTLKPAPVKKKKAKK